MTRHIIAFAAAACLLAPAGIAAQTQDVALRAAMETETVKGDLKAAIDQYRKIVDATHDRAVAATALVRMAECYQKLGDAQARPIFERVVRDYTDQKPALDVARARLAALSGMRGRRTIELHKVWTDTAVDVPMLGGISPDGRYLTYAGQFNTAVILRDLTTGEERTIAEKGATVSSAISRDGELVAYDWCVDAEGRSGEDAPCELWVAPLRASNHGAQRRVFANTDVFRLQVHDWSPDGTRIAISLRRRDRTSQIGWVDAAGGTLHVLKSIDWRGPTRMFFSPDGQDLAFDLADSDRTDDHDVFVIALDGSREIPAAVGPGNDVVVGWSQDGRDLLFASDRRGAMGLWAQPFVDRKPQGAPTLVKADFGNVIPLGLTRSGALYMTAASWDEDIEIAPFDRAAKPGAPVRPIRRMVGTNNQPAWSPDGKWLAYQSARGTSLATGAFGGPAALAIRAGDSGETRELRPALSYFRDLTWAPDGQSLVVYGTDLKGRDGIFRIDQRSGDVTAIVAISRADEPGYEGLFWSPDGRRLFYRTRNGAVHARDLALGTERVLAGGVFTPMGTATPDSLGPISVSPDGRWIASTQGESAGARSVVLVPVTGGDTRALLRVDPPVGIFQSIVWAADSRSLLVLKAFRLDRSASELWQVPIDGAPARKLDFDARRVLLGGVGRMRLHPDGQQLTYVSGRYPTAEVWVLENFLSGLDTAK